MGYKLLGLAVWRVGKWYMRKRFAGARRKAAVAGLSALVVGGMVVAARQAASSE